jgi:ElaB/YqjD/DUF883 family membrane-anchored ribosome-binding protein
MTGSQDRNDPPAEQEHGTGALGAASYPASALDAPEDYGPSRPTGGESDFARLGNHVVSVLRAIEETAARIQEEAREKAEEARTAAENYASDRRSQADAEAREIVSAAKGQAASFSEDAERRHQMLESDISLAEGHLRTLATGLRDLADRLDNLLATPLGEGEEGRLAAGGDDSLTEALEPSRRPSPTKQ